MKKVFVLAIIALFVMVPFVSFAKTAVSDSDLSAVTAQEGVTITLNNVTVSNVSLDVQSWGDSDGFGSTYTSAGWVGAAMTLQGNVISLSGAMTIDVGTNTTTNTTAVQIGLPTVQIGGQSGAALNIIQVVKLANNMQLTGANAGVLGTAYMSNVKATITGGVVITAH